MGYKHQLVRCGGVALAAALLLGGCAKHEGHADAGLKNRTRDGRMSPLLRNLGKYQRQVSAKSEDGARFFNQGLILVYGFNHAEALRSFEEAARVEPQWGMAYWGQALALAPNINDSAIGPDREKQGYEAIQKALANKAGLSPVEAALVDALAARFVAGEKVDRAKLNQAYAAAMRTAYDGFPEDPDVATLYADAVMNTMPWDYWSKDGKAKPGVNEAVAALEHAIQVSPEHPGANHIYIHAVEASSNPDRAVPSADRLGGLVPGAGHLVHMPSHIFIRVGRYADGTEANLKAIAADEDYITQCRAQGIYPAAYYPHNIHFLSATLSMEGRSRETLEASKKVATQHEHKDMQDPKFGFPQLLHSIPYFSMVRFGRWDEILAEKDPGSDVAFVQGMWRFARGMALAARKDGGGAEKELAALREIAAKPALAELKIFDVNSLAQLSAIAAAFLEGETASARGKSGEAVRALEKAVALEDALTYSEPPDWPIPPRQYLGALLLKEGRAKEAERVYREDLKRHRNNGWSLKGLEASLRGQGKKAEAEEVASRFREAWARSDVRIDGSRL
jgi:tetratricopeptide (TPR) repeat protein